MPRPIAKDHDDKRLAILHKAARLFADQGYGRASMSEVARACGISKANIYHYYPSKEALLFDMLDSHLRGLRDHICGLRFNSTGPEDQLRDIIAEILLCYQGADAEHDVLLGAARALPPTQQDELRSYQKDIVTFCEARLAQLAPAAIAQNQKDMRTLTMSLFGMLNWHYKWSSSADQAARRRHAQLIADLMIGGIPNLST